jgi:hypothetical protein
MADENDTTTPEEPTGAGQAHEPEPEREEPGDEPKAASNGLGEAGKRALQAEREAPKKAEKAAAEHQKQLESQTAKIRHFEDRDKTELERLQSRAESAAQEREKALSDAATARLELTKFQVARDKKLPAEWIDRLRGSSQEELEADADSLLAVLKEQEKRRTPPSYDGGVRRQATSPTDMNSLIRRAAGLG